MPVFESKNGEIPEIDPRKFDHISSIITTFEEKDLKTQNVVSFFFDKRSQYVFMELLSDINGRRVIDNIFGYDKEKIISTCENVLNYFKKTEK